MNINIFPIKEEFESLLELYPPQLANKFLPEWYKKQDFAKYLDTRNTGKSIQARNCPAIQDIMTDGVIIPAWSDFYMYLNGDDIVWEVPVSKAFENYQWMGNQGADQIKDMPFKYHTNFGMLKINCPYYFQAPDGYGIEFSDPAYHLRRDIKILSGRVESDIWHETNFPFEFQVDLERLEGKKLMIKAGDPLIMLRLYKKDLRTNVSIEKYTEDFNLKQKKNSVIHNASSNEWIKYKRRKNES
jgi:hypothetical protein